MSDDPIDDVVEGGSRMLLTATSLVAQRVAAARQQRFDAERQTSESEAGALAQRAEAAQAAAHAQFAATTDDGWWDEATPRDVVDVAERAATYTELDDPIAREALGRIEHQVSERYGDDVAGLSVVADQEVARAAEARLWAIENAPEDLARYVEATVDTELLTLDQARDAEGERERAEARILALYDTAHEPPARDVDPPVNEWDSAGARATYRDNLAGADHIDDHARSAAAAADRMQAHPPAAAVTARGKRPITRGTATGRGRTATRTVEQER